MPISLIIRQLGCAIGSARCWAGSLRNPRRPSGLSIGLPGQLGFGLSAGVARHAGCCAMGMVISPIKVFSRDADSSDMHICGGPANAGPDRWISQDPQDRRHERTRELTEAVPGTGCRLTSLPSRFAPIPGLDILRPLLPLRPYNSPKFLQQAATTADMLKARQLFPRPNHRIRDPEFPSPTHFPV